MDFPFLSRWSPQLLSVLRIITALLFFSHGSAKIFGYPFIEGLSGVPIGSLYGIAGIIEIIAGVLLVIGLFSRLVAFIVSGEMATLSGTATRQPSAVSLKRPPKPSRVLAVAAVGVVRRNGLVSYASRRAFFLTSSARRSNTVDPSSSQ